ncbi:DNA-binding SARP family transcriptional activator/predicted negative regulator of RcsB-dependent stress response [Streptomyces sp. 3330]|uniref:AfsR/SARP family transcriptional regulator n=1 Tax=Streptomyces sp. 3330 TaxID=2817755 RepID=UPI00285C7CF2|nr:BTAD domain-containing putative transcriptional regulator [Streptomyces sp. 3330]MDR6974295.1 DNA-binding SARP family transcriptional activator/predicted negative regulator of RcsB-dependent stress response [Streptomyces sp. 3330]
MAEAGIPGIRFSLLGRLRAYRGTEQIDLGAPQQQAVAAALLLAHGRSVSMSDLVDAIWERPPRSPASVIRTYVWRLRHTLEPDQTRSQPWQMLQSATGGYLLHVDDDRVDWRIFQQRLGQARAAHAGGDPAAARRLYDECLGLWHEDPLTGVPGPLAASERSVMQRQRLDALEARLETLVAEGHFAEAATDAAALAEQHPLREGLVQLLMQALYRSGRQAEALAVYRKAHRLLDEELGVRPGPGLQALQAEILQARRPASGDAGIVQRRTPVPRQIPHAIADFTGRVQEIERIRDTLTGHTAEAMPIVLVSGMGGAGKTSLVMHSVQPVLPSYPDGQLYADLRGADGTPADPGTVLSSFLRALGEADAFIPQDLNERSALLRTLLAQRRALIILDNAADMNQVLPLLPGSPSCAVVITSRNTLATLPVSLRLSIGALPTEEALRLFTRLVGGGRVAAEPHTARQVLAACGGLPLAIRIIGSRLAARPDWSMEQLAERLSDERHRLSELSVDAVAVASSFALGYAQLDDLGRRAFRLLAVPAQSGFDASTAAAVLTEPEEAVRPTLERLVNAGLLESPAWDRYRYHDLVLLFAQRLAADIDAPADRHAALGRLLDLHLFTASGSYHIFRPGHTVPRTALPSPRSGPRFKNEQAVLAWASSTLSDILRLLQQTARTHTDRAATLLLMLDAVLMNAHRWHEVVPVATAVTEAAATKGDVRAEGRARYMLAGALTQVGRMDDARGHIQRALDLAELVGDADIHGMALNVHGIIIGLADPAGAISHHLQAAAIASRHGNTSLEALALSNMVQTKLRMGVVDDETATASQRQLQLHHENGDRYGEAFGLYRHGQVLLAQGKPHEAIDAHLRTLALLDEDEQEFVQAGAHIRLSEAYLHVGRTDLASKHAEQGLALSRKARHDQLASLALSALGDVLAATNRKEQARLHWQRALDDLRRLGYAADAARVAARLADGAAST